jgi:glyoxylase-like metal-dependent hydrolase (beta-lactamase superfamily II)
MKNTRHLGLALVFALLLGRADAAAQQNFDTVQVRAAHLAGSVHMLTGSGGNIGLVVGDDAVFIVDDQFAPLTQKIKAAIAAITPRPVKFVFNTHWHFDHTGGNENFGEAGALIVAHDNVRKRMSTDQLIQALDMRFQPSPRGALPVVTFNDAISFHLNGDSITAFHVPPAHTDGDAVVVFKKANVVHMGDLFVSDRFPFVDLSSGGSINGVIGAAERVLKDANTETKIIPGHGPIANRGRLEAYHAMLVALRDRMRREIAAKKTIEQILASDITARYDAEWRAGRERFIRLLHQELSR